jgi:hypothetical protein
MRTGYLRVVEMKATLLRLMYTDATGTTARAKKDAQHIGQHDTIVPLSLPKTFSKIIKGNHEVLVSLMEGLWEGHQHTGTTIILNANLIWQGSHRNFLGAGRVTSCLGESSVPFYHNIAFGSMKKDRPVG